MDSIHISQFYSCSEVQISTEMLYIAELGKYLYLNYNKPLSIDGVILNSVLKKSVLWDFFRLAISKGWIVDTNLPSYETDITYQFPIDWTTTKFKNFYFTTDGVVFDSVDTVKRSQDAEYNYSTPVPTQVCFTKMTDEAWYWTINGSSSQDSMINSASFNTTCASKAWISMIAMVAVERLMTGKPKILGIEFPYVIAHNQLALSDFLVLIDETDALTGWVLYSYESSISDKTQRQLGYEAWWYRGREKGLLDKWYKPKEKYLYLTNTLKLGVGDVVLLYERNYLTQYNYVKSIDNCHVAIIRYVDSSLLGLEIINTVKTKYGAEVAFQSQPIAVRNMYCGTSTYKEWNSKERGFDLKDIGVEYLMYTEKFFIIPLDEADDLVEMDVSDNNGRSGRYILHQNDAIYWLLKDYNIDFNEEGYLKRYFRDSRTAYEVFMSGGNLPEEWKVKPKN